jgi:formylmethanofuran dehydrogenase subunit E
MTGCTLTQEQIKATQAFHGHWCPGLALGLRVAELGLKEFGSANDEDIVCVTETDMCAVDAIQFLMSCTFGKGNLIHRDWGKAAFTFYSRDTGKGLRVAVRDEFWGREMSREDRIEEIMNASLETLFVCTRPEAPVPSRAHRLESLVCEECGEKTMESRTRRFGGRVLCIPCFTRLEQR